MNAKWSRRESEPDFYLLLHARLTQNLGMKWWAFVLVFLVAPSSPARSSRDSIAAADPSYRAALAAANRFLHAWQTQDHETGIMMLTDAAREQVSRERLQDFFSTGPDAAFEIQRGKHVNGEYVFP